MTPISQNQTNRRKEDQEMSLREEVRKNASDIHVLTVNITKLTTVVESAEKRRDSDMAILSKAVDNISGLKEHMGQALGIEKDITELRSALAELKGDIRTVRHDLNNATNAISGIALLGEKVNGLSSDFTTVQDKVNSFEKWKDKIDGAGGALKGVGSALWAVFGAATLAVCYFVLKDFFKDGGM